jgi:putative transposase
MDISTSGFYDWVDRPMSKREEANRELDTTIMELWKDSKKRKGYPMITQDLRAVGQSISKNRIARRMRTLGIQSVVRRKFKATTNSKHRFPVAPNLLERNFNATEPDKVWVSDITYLRVAGAWLYLVVFIDLYSRCIVSWSVSRSLDHAFVLAAFNKAVWRFKPGTGLIIHSDRGVQYACDAFRQAIGLHGFIQSMSRKGDCWDNAVAESFFAILKTELVYQNDFYSLKEAEKALFEYIEVDYNRKRRHSTIDYKIPYEYHLNFKCA